MQGVPTPVSYLATTLNLAELSHLLLQYGVQSIRQFVTVAKEFGTMPTLLAETRVGTNRCQLTA